MTPVWQKAAALALGTSIAVTIALVGSAVVPACQGLGGAIEQVQLDGGRSRAEQRRNLILAELAENPGEAWAGRYLWFSGYESRELDLSPRGFYFEYSHCMGTGDLAYGDVSSVEGQRVRLAPLARFTRDEPRAPEPDRRTDFWFENDLYCIPWGDERFLVPAGLMPEFCKLVHGTRRESMEYADYPRKVKPGEQPTRWGVEPIGLPDVPAEFRPLLPE